MLMNTEQASSVFIIKYSDIWGKWERTSVGENICQIVRDASGKVQHMKMEERKAWAEGTPWRSHPMDRQVWLCRDGKMHWHLRGST